MPIALHRHEELDLMVFAAEGSVTASEVFEAAEKHLFGSVRPAFRTVWDLTQAQSVELSSEDLWSIPRLLSDKNSRFRERHGGRTAFVAAEDLSYGLLRMFARYSRYHAEHLGIEVDFRVFSDMGDAMNWVRGDSAAGDEEA